MVKVTGIDKKANRPIGACQYEEPIDEGDMIRYEENPSVFRKIPSPYQIETVKGMGQKDKNEP